MEQSYEPVGITLVTGFLGSGKSTFIRRVLTEQHGLRIVVVENEFGDSASIEQAIVTQGVGPGALEEFIELPNGCICCQAQDELVDSLTRLVEQKSGRFDHILVEASGLADPRPVAASLWVDAVADAALRLDSVIAIVDASRVEQPAKNNNEKGRIQDDYHNNELARMQVAVADTVLLNKMDLVGGDSKLRSEIEERLRRYGCTGEIISTVKCQVDIASLLNVRKYDSDAAVSSLADNTANNHAPSKFSDHYHDTTEDVGHVDGNTSRTQTFTISFRDLQFNETLLNRALGHLLWDDPEEERTDNKNCSSGKKDRIGQIHRIWRMKALIVMDDDKFKWIFQSVHTLFDNMVSSVRADDGTSQFLFIGEDMDEVKIRDMLSTAISPSSNGEDNDT